MITLIKRILKSIALLPAVMVLCFMLLALLLVVFQVNYESYDIFYYFTITSKSDIQFILSFIIGGIFTLTIFSYTMVMNVLNRNINNYSPRLIPLLLAERHHQIILGFTTGTIAYSMVLAMVLNNSNLNYFPAIATALSILFGIVCLLLYIYFLHSVSQSIHVNYIIHEVYKDGTSNLKKLFNTACSYSKKSLPDFKQEIKHDAIPGYLHLPDIGKLITLSRKRNYNLHIATIPGDFIQKGDVLTFSDRKLTDDEREELCSHLVIDHTVTTDVFENDIKHLVEVAIKGSSPAINDPGTSLNAIHYITSLFLERFALPEFNAVEKNGQTIYMEQVSFENLYKMSFEEMNHYMSEDPVLKIALHKATKKIRDAFPDFNFITLYPR